MIVVNCPIFHKEFAANGIEEYPLYKSMDFFLLRIGRVFRKFGLPFFHNINKNIFLSNDLTCIIFDNGIVDAKNILKYIASGCKKKRLIFFYWNPVERSVNPELIPPEFEKWSYSPKDCKLYGMRYNSTFYFEEFYEQYCEEEYDVFFAGKNKGRLEDLKKIKEQFDDLNIKSLFYITATHPRFQKKGFSKLLPYKKILQMTKKSRSILDYYYYSDAGLSLRAMEAIFFNKKIITNNITYKMYDFYDKSRVFILGEDDVLQLPDFLKAESQCVDFKTREYYLFKNWLDRFSI